MRWPPTFGGPSSAQDPRREIDTFPELDKGQSPKPNSTGPTWAKAKGIDSLRPNTVHTGTELGPPGPEQWVRRKGKAFVAPFDNFVLSLQQPAVRSVRRANSSTLHDH